MTGADAIVESQSALIARLYPRLVGYFGYHGFPLGDSEDLAQETLARVVDRWDRVSTVDGVDAWVFRVASNLSASWLRRLRTARRKLPLLVDDVSVVDAGAGVEVRDAVRRLPSRQREAVVLRYFAQLSVRETAASMKCAEGTVRALTSQALGTLRDELSIPLDVQEVRS